MEVTLGQAQRAIPGRIMDVHIYRGNPEKNRIKKSFSLTSFTSSYCTFDVNDVDIEFVTSDDQQTGQPAGLLLRTRLQKSQLQSTPSDEKRPPDVVCG